MISDVVWRTLEKAGRFRIQNLQDYFHLLLCAYNLVLAYGSPVTQRLIPVIAGCFFKLLEFYYRRLGRKNASVVTFPFVR